MREQTLEALRKGAKAHLNWKHDLDEESSPYLAPEVLTNVNHQMAVMREESFGPVVGIMKVADDDEAITLMNDSPYGLTASIWTEDLDAAAKIGARVETGTVFANRCDYLDPALVWTGVKDTGKGGALSEIGYANLTQPKSYHLQERSEEHDDAQGQLELSDRGALRRRPHRGAARGAARRPASRRPLLVTDAGLVNLPVTQNVLPTPARCRDRGRRVRRREAQPDRRQRQRRHRACCAPAAMTA